MDSSVERYISLKLRISARKRALRTYSFGRLTIGECAFCFADGKSEYIVAGFHTFVFAARLCHICKPIDARLTPVARSNYTLSLVQCIHPGKFIADGREDELIDTIAENVMTVADA